MNVIPSPPSKNIGKSPTKQAQKKASQPAKTPVKQPTKQAVKQQAIKEQEDDDLDQPIPVEFIISNDVLEAEVQNINQKIAAYKVKKASPPEDLVDRKQAAEMALQLLQVKVSTGQLNEEVYSKQLQAKIEEEKELAKKMIRNGRKDRASEAVFRYKTMEKELQAMQEQQ